MKFKSDHQRKAIMAKYRIFIRGSQPGSLSRRNLSLFKRRKQPVKVINVETKKGFELAMKEQIMRLGTVIVSKNKKDIDRLFSPKEINEDITKRRTKLRKLK